MEIESNLPEVTASLEAAGLRAGARAFAVTRMHGQLLVTRVQRRASLPRSGPPGPRLITGHYLRSWNLQMEVAGGTITASAGTNAPQGRRLEMGFTGVDSMGRRYAQPPYPHAGPALDETVPGFLAAIAAMATEGL